MAEASQTGEASINGEVDQAAFTEDHRVDNKIVLPEDGYGWRKYGQKFIKSLQKYRSYYKCRRNDCRAKKRAEWRGPESSIRVVYDGVHTHPSSSQEGTSTSAPNPTPNSFNLLTQVLGDQITPSKP